MAFKPKDYGRGRCNHCNRSYRKIEYNQAFCKEQCHKEFHAAGGMSFGRIAKLVESRVSVAMKGQRALIVAELERRGTAKNQSHQELIQSAIDALRKAYYERSAVGRQTRRS